MTDPYVELAKLAIETHVKSGKTVTPEDLPAGLPNGQSGTRRLPAEAVNKRAGVFVSLHQKNGALRGCIGTFSPVRTNIAQEIIANAMAAATQDPRFPAISENELPFLHYSVDILSEPKKIDSNTETLDPKKYGLIVSTPDGRRGLLLPDIPGVETAAQQVEICRQKAGIPRHEPVQMEIFTVERHKEI
jgi:AmmeMemoRadiSam system protein A